MKKHAIIVAALAAIMVLPGLFLACGSLMEPAEVLRYYGGTQAAGHLHLWPDVPSLSSWYQVLLRRPDYLLKFWNSLLLTGVICLPQAAVSCLAGYALAKLWVPCKRGMVFWIILAMLTPVQVSLVCNYLVLERMGLIGQYASVVLPSVFSAFGVFFMMQFFARLPDELLEAARLDGAGPLRCFVSIALPCARPGWAALTVLSFIDVWNMVEQPLIYLQNKAKFPLSVFLANSLEQDLALSFACSVLALLPPLLGYLFFQEELLTGIGETTLKEGRAAADRGRDSA